VEEEGEKNKKHTSLSRTISTSHQENLPMLNIGGAALAYEFT
jgi:hypothetical protein